MQESIKASVARHAAKVILSKVGPSEVIGIGTGTTVKFFIDELAKHKSAFRAAVSSSEQSSRQLAAHGIALVDLNAIRELNYYVDGADEINAQLEMIKGGGGALTREKIIADCAEEFICIADQSKFVETLGHFPLPVEVIPIARRQVTQKLEALGARVSYREGLITDNGNHILDVHGLNIDEPRTLEHHINNMTGVVTNGIFAHRPADLLLLGSDDAIKTIQAKPLS